jgi:hypothetical protein
VRGRGPFLPEGILRRLVPAEYLVVANQLRPHCTPIFRSVKQMIEFSEKFRLVADALLVSLRSLLGARPAGFGAVEHAERLSNGLTRLRL